MLFGRPAQAEAVFFFRGSVSRILCYGVVGVDYLLKIGQYPESNGHARVRREDITIGGEAANTAVRLSQLGFQVTLMGNPVGTDSLGRHFLDAISHHEVDCLVETTEGTTGHAYVVSDAEGSRTIFGAFGELSGPSVPAGLWSGIDLVTLDSFVAGAEAIGRLARERNIPVVSIEAAPGSGLAGVSTIVINSAGFMRRHEAGDPAEIGEGLLSDGVDTAIVTRGASGADVFTEDGYFHVSPVPVDVVDTTGAGDGFRAGLIAGILEAFPLQDSLKLASAVLGLSCCYYGGCVCGGGLDSVLEAAPLA